MTQEEAERVKHLAKGTIEAIKTIYLDWAYKQNEHRGMRPLNCKWKWKPEPGQWCMWGGAILLVTGVNDYRLSVSGVGIIEEINVNQVIPILPWEDIQRILEEIGYNPYFERHPILNILEYPPWFAEIQIPTKHECYDIIRGESNTRQEAIMKMTKALANRVSKGR